MTSGPALAPWSLFGRRHAVVPGGAPADLVDALLAGSRRSRYGHVTGGRQVSIASAFRSEIRWATETVSGLAATCHLGSPFHPTETSYIRILPGEHQEPPRRENRYYAECVAIMVLSGHGELAVHHERFRDRLVDRALMRPGDVVLLRGWSPLGFADPRPYYRSRASEGPLTVFRARHNLASGDQPSAWLPALTRREVEEAMLRAAYTAGESTPTAAAAVD